MICDIMLCLLINEILFKIHNFKGVFFQNQTICVTIVSIVLFRLINISLIASSFQPRLDRLGQISWLSLLADHQSLTSRRRTSSLLLLFWLSTLRGSFVPKLLAWVSPGCRARLVTCRSWSPKSRAKAGSLWQRGILRCMPYLNLSHTWR